MGMTNTQQLTLAKSYLGDGGAVFRKYCGLRASDPYCAAYVTTIFARGGNSALFYGGRICVGAPAAIAWCRKNLAQIPIALAMESDIVLFDWEPNGVPNHIGFADYPDGATILHTVEGNTSELNEKGETIRSGVVAKRTRTAKEIQAIFRPYFKATFDLSKPLTIDGRIHYNTIAKIQQALGIPVDGILGQETVKAIQKKAGVTQDGSWGPATTKAVQKLLGVPQDGLFGPESCKALQRWAEANASGKAPVKPTPEPVPAPTKVAVDGKMGPATVKATQKLFGTPEDGVISGQLKTLEKYYPAINAVTFGGGGSFLIMRLQKWLGKTQDGVLGKETIKAWQKLLGVKQDGYFGTDTCKAWQKYINEHEELGEGLKPSNADLIANKAVELAYTGSPKIAAYPTGKPTAEYKAALNKAYPDRSGWGKGPKAGASCDVYVGTVVRTSGVDKDFPRGLDQQQPYLDKSDKFKRVLNLTGRDLKEDELQDGDIITYRYKTGRGHICIWKDGKLKHAHLDKWYGRTTNQGGRFEIEGKKWIRVYRAK